MLFPPWTVTRQQYTASLSAQHSGISNEVLLFSEVGVVAGSSLSRAQSGPASCYVSWEVLGAAARSLTGEHDHADSGVGHPALPVLRWHPRQAGRMVWVLRLGLRDVGGDIKDRFWICLLGSRLSLRSSTRGWRPEPFFFIVVRHFCWCLRMFRALIWH